MLKFFHARRRKMGLLTLLIAWGFMTLWLKSEYRKDSVSLVDYGSRHIALLSLEIRTGCWTAR
jgi:hypothetical protein